MNQIENQMFRLTLENSSLNDEIDLWNKYTLFNPAIELSKSVKIPENKILDTKHKCKSSKRHSSSECSKTTRTKDGKTSGDSRKTRSKDKKHTSSKRLRNSSNESDPSTKNSSLKSLTDEEEYIRETQPTYFQILENYQQQQLYQKLYLSSSNLTQMKRRSPQDRSFEIKEQKQSMTMKKYTSVDARRRAEMLKNSNEYHRRSPL